KVWDFLRPKADASSDAGHAGLAVVLSLGAIVGSRLLADDISRRRVAAPPTSPTASPSPSVTPAPTPSPTPSIKPTPPPLRVGDKVRYTSENGVWELWYPAGLLAPIHSDHSGAELANFREHSSEVEVPIEIDVEDWRRGVVYKLHDARTVDDLLRVMCEASSVLKILECKKININGRIWGWALISSTDGESPGTFVDMRTIIDRRIYFASGNTLLGKNGLKHGIPLIREVLETVELHL
ncbi:MAG: hypothetical protein WEB06_08680, partial [Actinomycetota bacterium]